MKLRIKLLLGALVAIAVIAFTPSGEIYAAGSGMTYDDFMRCLAAGSYRFVDDTYIMAEDLISIHESAPKVSSDELVVYFSYIASEDNINESFNIAYKLSMDSFFLRGEGGNAGGATNGGKISGLTIVDVQDQAYTGKAVKPDVDIFDGTTKLKKGTDYSLSYKNNKKIGTATITIKGKGSYSGNKKITFNIIPKAVKLSSVKANANKGTVAIKWNKITGAAGYKIYYSTKRTGEFKLLKTISGAGKTSFTATTLDKGYNYYFKVCAYKKSGKKTIIGFDSEIKPATIPAKDGSVKLDLTDFDDSVDRINVKAADMVGDSAYITWGGSPSATERFSSFQIYRQCYNSDNCYLVAEITNTEQDLYIDSITASVTEYYYVRGIKDGVPGEFSQIKLQSEDTNKCAWYMSDNGPIRVSFEGATPIFTTYFNNSEGWCCEWPGSRESGTYTVEPYTINYNYFYYASYDPRSYSDRIFVALDDESLKYLEVNYYVNSEADVEENGFYVTSERIK